MQMKALIPAALTAMLFALPAAAQDMIRVAVCNPAKVFEQIDERKAIETQVNGERERIKVDAQRRKLEIDEIRRQMGEVNPGSDLYKEKNQQLLQKAIEFDVWAKLTEQSLQRTEKELLRNLYDKIKDATKEVAEGKQIDLVMSERQPDLSGNKIDAMTPDQVRAAIATTDVLYRNAKADITGDVVLLLNKKFATGAAGGAEKKDEKKP